MDDLEQRVTAQHQAWLEQERQKQRLRELYQAATIAAAIRAIGVR